jgi:hypothetical protein
MRWRSNEIEFIGGGFRRNSYLRALMDTVSSTGHGPAPWWYVMSASASVAIVGSVTRHALARTAGLVLGGLFILLWFVVGAIEYRRHK